MLRAAGRALCVRGQHGDEFLNLTLILHPVFRHIGGCRIEKFFHPFFTANPSVPNPFCELQIEPFRATVWQVRSYSSVVSKCTHENSPGSYRQWEVQPYQGICPSQSVRPRRRSATFKYPGISSMNFEA